LLLEDALTAACRFYFSYNYDVTRTLQSNMGGLPRPILDQNQQNVRLQSSRCAVLRLLRWQVTPWQASVMHTFDEKFVWNLHLLRDVPQLLLPWCVLLAHGFAEQRRFILGFNRVVSIVLLARRSRHFAGTRYNKRGQDMRGHCANEVEVEQIVADESHGTSLGGHNHTSFVQLRASIPLFWSQPSAGLHLKPEVCVANFDPLYHATALHFGQLMRRYGSPIYVLNLVKREEKKKRESLLSEEFCAAVQMLNAGVSAQEHAIRYVHFDFTQEHKQDKKEDGTDTHIDRLFKLTSQIVDHVGIFHAGSNRWAKPKSADVPVASCMQQRGILRSNCVDCLDRTNAAQYRAGERALMLQLQALGLSDDYVPSGCIETNEDTSQLGILYSLYLNLGNQLASQYVGSEAHDKTGAGQSDSWYAGVRVVNKVVVSAQRYISNSFKDQEKQQAIDVFLGIYNPRHVPSPIWLSEDRSFVWSSRKYYEYCPPRSNRPPDGWWEQPLQTFLNGVQVLFCDCASPNIFSSDSLVSLLLYSSAFPLRSLHLGHHCARTRSRCRWSRSHSASRVHQSSRSLLRRGSREIGRCGRQKPPQKALVTTRPAMKIIPLTGGALKLQAANQPKASSSHLRILKLRARVPHK
jgi:hypothetical protein